MSLLSFYRAALCIAVLSYLVLWYFPYMDKYLDSGQQEFLSYSGSWAIYLLPDWLSWSLFIAWNVGALGMLLMRRLGRFIFLISVVLLIPLNILAGFTVISPPEALLSHVVTSSEAVVLTLAYFSPLKERFW